LEIQAPKRIAGSIRSERRQLGALAAEEGRAGIKPGVHEIRTRRQTSGVRDHESRLGIRTREVNGSPLARMRLPSPSRIHHK
jgi:hypothetical protein